MQDLLIVTGIAWLAGLAAFIGGVIAHFEGSAETVLGFELGMVAHLLLS